MRTKTILKKARARVELHWWQGALKGMRWESNDEAPVCAVGAVNWAISGDPQNEDLKFFQKRRRKKALKALFDVLPKAHQYKCPRIDSPIVGFNDALKTTKEDVLNLFDRAIDASR